ncbi:T-cell surface glycoprotein CD1b-1, partial [Apaloderma vittatum]
GTFTLWLLQTSIFENTYFVNTERLGLLEDIEIASLNKYTQTFHFLQPWVQPALRRSDWHTYEEMVKVYSVQFSHTINEAAMQNRVSYSFIIQCRAGCELFPNRTSRAFIHVGYNGQDLVSLNIENCSWQLGQDTNVSRYVKSLLQSYTAFTELVDVIFSETCVDVQEVFLHYGKKALERQEQPEATVFACMPSSAQLLLVCRVTGFYPHPISVAWLWDGQEVLPGLALNTSSILPNANLTYQLRSIPAVVPGDGHSYICRVCHRSLGSRSLLIQW